ncbi:MAG: cytochrome c oxidase subunit 2 [Acidimicrobiales bacterium]
MNFMTRKPTRWRLLLAAVTTLIVTACAEEKPLNTFEPRGPQARSIDNLMKPIWIIMAIVFVLVIGGGIALAIKGRVKPEDYDPEDLPPQVHGNDKLEIGWTVAPAILLAIICVPTVAVLWQLEEQNDPSELDVMVIGRQWWWEYRYDVDGDGFFQDVDGDGVAGDDDDMEWPLELALDPDDLSVANELVIPAGQQIDLVITSGDVIHSFWIPRLNGKRDAVPGRFATWSLHADEPGKYTGWCTEYCGLSHARMRMSTIALSEAEFATWFANQIEPADIPTEEHAAAGRQTFQQLCAACHILDDPEYDYGENFEAPLTAKAAPNLTHFATRSVMAGAIYSQYITDGSGNPTTDANDDALDVSSYLLLAENGRFNEAQLRRWVSDAPSQKDMAPDDQRGMPAFPALTEEDITNLVAYLATLD